MMNRFLQSLFFMLALASHGAALNCSTSCGSHGPIIRFPFRIKDKKRDCSGYPGFDITCSDNHTVLELPTSVKLYIHSIDYESQVMNASDPRGCLPRQHLNFSLSSSPFSIITNEEKSDYTLFNCSPKNRRAIYNYGQVPCLSTLRYYEVYVILASNNVNFYDLISCTKMYDISSVPEDVFRQNASLHLSWSIPKGQVCKLKDNSSLVECYGKDGQTNWRKGLTAGVILTFILFAIVVIALYHFYRSHSSHEIEAQYGDNVEMFLNDYRAGKPSRYTYADLKKITNQFNDELGRGAFGTVFKGMLTTEIPVVVKLLNVSTGNGEEFIKEVGIMARIHHVNVVRLIGFCADGFRRAVIYEYLPKDSLQKLIFSANTRNHFLGWDRLHQIALGVAKGMEYLHQGCDQRILHFNIKPHNILLDSNYNPKIADFSMATLCSKDTSVTSMTKLRGTLGYRAPEVFSSNFGNVSDKADVYSFGKVLLEMVEGRNIVDDMPGNGEEVYITKWVRNLLEKGEDLRIPIEAEEDSIPKKLAIVGLWCIQWNPADRPSMKFVVQMLESEGDNLRRPPNPFSSSVPNRRRLGSCSVPNRRRLGRSNSDCDVVSSHVLLN